MILYLIQIYEQTILMYVCRVHICPPLVAVCHKAATASSFSGLAGSQKQEANEVQACSKTKTQETEAVRQLLLHERQDLNTQTLLEKKINLIYHLFCSVNPVKETLLKSSNTIRQWQSGQEGYFSLCDSYSSTISDQ